MNFARYFKYQSKTTMSGKVIINKFNHYYLILLLIILTISLASCSKENPVKPEDPVPVDTVDLYEWRKIPTVYFNNIFVPDTSNIYICGSNVALKWDGSSNPPTLIDFKELDFIPGYVKGIDNGNVFFIESYNPSRVRVKRMQNNIITETIFFDSTKGLSDFYPISQNEFWTSTNRQGRGLVIHYLNGQFIKLFLPDSIYTPQIYNKDGNLYIIAEKSGNGSNIPPFLNCYKINNNNLEFIRGDSLSQYNHGITNRLFQIGKDIIMYDERGKLLKFTGYDWAECIESPGFSIWGLGGKTIDSLVAFTYAADGHNIYTRFGMNWKKELKSNAVISFIVIDLWFLPISVVGNNVYVMLGDRQGSFLLIGRKKVQNLSLSKL